MYYKRSTINAGRPVFVGMVMRGGRTLENQNAVETSDATPLQQLAPHLAGGLDDKFELSPLFVVRQLIARSATGETTLRRQRKLL